MKSKVTILIVIPFLLIAGWVYASHPWLGKTLNASQVKERWGEVPFEEQKFRNAGLEQRAKMAYSLMTSKKMIGLTTSQVRERLGGFDGHYFSESYPTYLIQRAEKKGDESWQIVFLIDQNKKTKDIIVHKNCCE
jgi:hypothetical protein